jgi:dipeptidyl aminopeptidase/acylaminoacyl peptidase
MDGTDARLLATQTEAGGALWFAPSGSLLAVSTRDHIDVIDLNTSSLKTVVTYPTLPEEYFPEVVWSPDAFGFKTVIPPQTGTGQAELLFVFPDGTLASLSKFSMLPLAENIPFISPDGGYVIFAKKMTEGRESLYLMDSSGATRPYGEPAASVRAYGWLPDSKRFAYGWDEPQHNFIGSVNGPPAYNETIFPPLVRWVKNEQYLALDSGNLILGDLSGAKLMIDSAVTDFDVVH